MNVAKPPLFLFAIFLILGPVSASAKKLIAEGAGLFLPARATGLCGTDFRRVDSCLTQKL